MSCPSNREAMSVSLAQESCLLVYRIRISAAQLLLLQSLCIRCLHHNVSRTTLTARAMSITCFLIAPWQVAPKGSRRMGSRWQSEPSQRSDSGPLKEFRQLDFCAL